MPASDREPREPMEPGDGPAPPATRESRRLAEPPSVRYAQPPSAPPPAGPPGSALPGPLARAGLVAVFGSVILAIVGAILASTTGLLVVAGATGAAVGLVLSRAAVPVGDAAPVPRRRVAWLAVGLSLAAVAVAAVITWVYARAEGGTLGFIDYQLATFGPFVPAEALIAAVTAWWGASSGPVQS